MITGEYAMRFQDRLKEAEERIADKKIAAQREEERKLQEKRKPQIELFAPFYDKLSEIAELHYVHPEGCVSVKLTELGIKFTVHFNQGLACYVQFAAYHHWSLQDGHSAYSLICLGAHTTKIPDPQTMSYRDVIKLIDSRQYNIWLGGYTVPKNVEETLDMLAEALVTQNISVKAEGVTNCHDQRSHTKS